MAQGSIHDLEILASAMRTGGFSEAAAELGITQPSVSQTVGRIERRFDTTLIARSHNEGEPVLTPTGKVLAPHLKRALRELDEAADEIASLEGRRPIRNGIPPMISRHFFKDQLAAIREACGTRPVEFCSYGSERMLHEIAHHSIDVGMVASCDRSMSLPGVRFSPVASFRLCAALRAAEGAGRTAVSLDEIANQMLI